MVDVNYLAIIVAGVVAMVIGGIWYGPLFGKAWMSGQGIDPNNREAISKMKKSAGPAYAQMFIGTLITGYVLAHIIWMSSIALPDYSPLARGFSSGFWSWLGFVLPIKYGDKLWKGKAFKYVAIDLGYYLVMLVVSGIIIAKW
jgi:hypothetical protein